MFPFLALLLSSMSAFSFLTDRVVRHNRNRKCKSLNEPYDLHACREQRGETMLIQQREWLRREQMLATR